MRCDEVAEFVSALGDGEVIARAAAEHVGKCAECKELLREYMEMGAELRVMASLTMDESVSPRVWTGRRNRFAILWQKGWETMRVPRLAFALLIAAIVALSSTFAVVEVRAHSNGSVVLLKVGVPGGGPFHCALSLVDKKPPSCGFLGQANGKTIKFQIKLMGRKGDGVELAVYTKIFESGSGEYSSYELKDKPQKQIYFEPGQTAKVDLAGLGTFTFDGEWLDHMPLFLGASTQDAQPGPEELRLVSPLLIRDKQVLGDFQGGSAATDEAGGAVEVFMPGEGRFFFALSPMRGAVQARVRLNRISFEDAGRSYVFVTGSPVSRSEQIWVVHEAKGAPWTGGEHVFITSGDLHEVAPELVMDGEGAKN